MRHPHQLIKRTMDIAVSLVGLICLLPLFCLISLAVMIDSPGSPFFVQTRVGRNGSLFGMIKFRSMYVDAGKRLDDPSVQTKAEAVGRVLKLKNDPRVTRIGRLLRTSSLDELPQIINVLLGQMSLVGPRALIPSMVAPYPDWSKMRHTVRPGITGLWQVSARERNESLADMIDYDLDYIRNFSPWLDTIIVLRTPGAVTSRKGAV